MSELSYSRGSERRFLLQVSAGIGIAATLLAMGKLWSNVASAEGGKDVPAKYVCLDGNAHGHGEPDVQSWSGDGVEPPSHTLDIPFDAGICYPTEDGTARVSGDRENPANGDWVRVDFGEVHRAIKAGTVVDVEGGKPATPEEVTQLGIFASNWPTDFLGERHTWVNVDKGYATNSLLPRR